MDNKRRDSDKNKERFVNKDDKALLEQVTSLLCILTASKSIECH